MKEILMDEIEFKDKEIEAIEPKPIFTSPEPEDEVDSMGNKYEMVEDKETGEFQ